MITRLNDILTKCSNIKFKTGYIKYLKSLNFEEFEKIFVYYASVIQIVAIKYENSRFFTKKWFKKYLLQLKFNILCNIFFEANFDYLIKIKDNIDIINKKREKILINIKNNKETLNNVLQLKFNVYKIPMTKEDLINFNILIIDNIYLTNELENLIYELNKLSNYP